MRRGLAGVLVADGASTAGDQIARVALAVLVFNRTDSPALSAATVAVSYLPWAVAAPLLSGLGDRYPRRTVMVASDAYRTIACAALVIPGLPVSVLLGLIFLLTCGEPPFRAARNALMPDLVGDELYVRAAGYLQLVSTGTAFAGYAVGGFLVAAIGSRASLALDTASFALSAMLLRALLPAMPSPPDHASISSRTGWSVVAGNPVARRALGIAAFVIALDSVSLGLAVPWAHQLHHGAGLAGLMGAATVIGGTVGVLAMGRVKHAALRQRSVLPLAGLLFLLLVPLVVVTDPAATLALLTAAGLGGSLQAVTQQTFIQAVPPAARARAAGVAGAVINLGQGASITLAGGLAQRVAPSVIVGGTGIVGLFVVCTLAIHSARADQRSPVPSGSLSVVTERD